MGEKLKCDCCGFVYPGSMPGLYYLEMFYKDKCGNCNNEIILCSNCHTKDRASREILYVDCKACIRDKKIDKIIK